MKHSAHARRSSDSLHFPVMKSAHWWIFWFLSACWFSWNVADPDLWGHVKYGDDLLRTGVLPRTDPYSYTAGDTPWINHELGAEVTLAWLARAGGWAIVLWKLLIGLATLTLVIRPSVVLPFVPWALFTFSALWTLTVGWSARPQLFSYLFFAVQLRLLERAHARPAILWWCVPLMVVWVNFHGGFLLGVGVLGIFLAVEVLDALADPARRNRTHLLPLLMIGPVALLATLANPYGAAIYRGLLDELSIARVQVREWGALAWLKPDLPSINVLVIAVVAALLLSRRPMRWSQRVLLAVLVVETQLHVRHGMFLALAALRWLPEHVASVWERFLPKRKAGWVRRPILDYGAWAVAGLIVLASGALVGHRLTGLLVPRSLYPVDCFRFMATHRLEGRIVVPFNWAQYLIHAFYPRLRVSFDGRYGTAYPPHILDLNFDLWFPDDPAVRSRDPSSPPWDPTAILSYKEPNLVLVDRRHRPAEAVLAKQTAWVLLYEDQLAQLYGRRQIYDRPTSRSYLAPEQRMRSQQGGPRSEMWPAHPESRAAR